MDYKSGFVDIDFYTTWLWLFFLIPEKSLELEPQFFPLVSKDVAIDRFRREKKDDV